MKHFRCTPWIIPTLTVRTCKSRQPEISRNFNRAGKPGSFPAPVPGKFQQISNGRRHGDIAQATRSPNHKTAQKTAELAGEPGFEPGLTESESAGLPLTYSPTGAWKQQPCPGPAWLYYPRRRFFARSIIKHNIYFAPMAELA